jgi:predicted MFS family arabinose efflux permease
VNRQISRVAGVAMGLLVVLVISDAGGVAVLYAVAFVLGLAETVYDSAARALLPQVIGNEKLDRANSLLTVEETLGETFLGAPIGSFLFVVAASLPLLLNAGGFVVAAVVLLGLHGRFRPVRTGARTSLRAEIGEGVTWLRRHRLLRGLTLISAGCAFLQTMANAILVLYVLEVLRLPEGKYGLVLVAAGVGALFGGILTPWLAGRVGRAAALTGGTVLSAVAIGAMALTRNGYIGAVLFALAGAGVMTWNVLTMSLRQAIIPERLFGRVQGAYRTLVFGGIPLGALAGGALASAIGIRPVFAAAGLGLLMFAGLLGRLVYRHRDELDPNGAPATDAVLAAL